MELSTQKAQFPKHPQQLNGSASRPFGVLAAGLESTWDGTTLDKGKTGMNSETKRQLEECFELEAAIKAEYLEGQLNREKLHGDLDSRYRRIERLCRQLEALPLEVREFARFKNAVTVPDEDVRLFFQRVLGAPEYFTDLTGLLFRQMLKKIDDCATDWGIDPSNIDRLLARARFTGILDSGFRLKEHFRNVISAYLAMSIQRVERKPSFLLSSIAPF